MSERLNQAVRQERRRERLGQQNGIRSRCAQCGERHPATLHKRDSEVICYQCHAENAGASGLEAHHIDGKGNSSDTIKIPANDHRILSEYQRDWPDATLRNSDASPLLAMAARLRGFLDYLKLLVDRVLAWIPASLEALDSALGSLLGPRWWERSEFAPFLAVAGLLP